MGGSRCDLEKVNQSRVLHLLGLGLKFIPAPVFRCTCLVRLDLAYNQLPEVPASIALLTSLEHLWLQGNPIESIHADIQNCTRLKVLDLRDTALIKIPHEIGRLPKILEIDLRGAPLKEKLREFQRDTERLMGYLRERDTRKQIKVELFNKLSMGLYREALNSPTARKNLAPLIKAVCLAFNDLHELGQVARHCNRLFPASLAGASDPKASVVRLREKFSVLRGKIERKRLASRLELKMRAIYYDVVEPSAVEEYIASIYKQVEPLEDIQFIVRHAGAVFPTNPEDITGEGIERNMLDLQKEMTNQRKRCVDELFEELNHRVYSDQDSSKVLKLTQEVAGVFAGGRRFAETSELEALKQLRADSKRYFPANIQEAEPERIRATFVAHRREQRQRQQQQ